MSTSGQNNKAQETKPSYNVPKKFVFDFVNSPSKKEESSEILNSSKDYQKVIPQVHVFNDPDDYEEAYENVCDHLLLSYQGIKETLHSVQDILNFNGLIP